MWPTKTYPFSYRGCLFPSTQWDLDDSKTYLHVQKYKCELLLISAIDRPFINELFLSLMQSHCNRNYRLHLKRKLSCWFRSDTHLLSDIVTLDNTGPDEYRLAIILFCLSNACLKSLAYYSVTNNCSATIFRV